MELTFPLSERECLILWAILCCQIRYLREVVAMCDGTYFALPSALHGEAFTFFLPNNRSARPSMTREGREPRDEE